MSSITNHTLAFLIDSPMQSWAVSSRFGSRDTLAWPTKSGLIGILAAAMGIDKYSSAEEELLKPLTALHTTILRWPKANPALRLIDFHTVGGGYDKTKITQKYSIPAKASGGADGTTLTHRTYLTEARFIVLLQGPHSILTHGASALENPKWGIWFGRKCCLPATPLGPVIAPNIPSALLTLAKRHNTSIPPLETMSGVTEDTAAGAYYQNDVPISFGDHHGPFRINYHPRPIRHFEPGEFSF